MTGILTQASLNVPGKKREPLNYAGRIPLYRKEIQATIVPDCELMVVKNYTSMMWEI